MQAPVWVPGSGAEDKLLLKYLETVGGAAFMEVPVGKNEPPHTQRVIDALRIPATSGESAGRWKFPTKDKDKTQDFWARLSAASEIEVIEVKEQLGPFVIGQAYAGKLLVEDELATTASGVNKVPLVKPVVVCRGERDGEPTEGLLQVCRALNITVRKVDLGPGKAKPEVRWYRLELRGIVEGGKLNTPNRAVIGQLITARQLLEAAHRNLSVNLTIECDGEGNVSLRSVCEKLGIAVVHTPNSRPAAASPPIGVQRPRRPPLNFRDMHIDTGSRLKWKDGPQTAVVSSDRLVIFNGGEMSLTRATSQILGYRDHPCAHWEYKESHRSRPRILSEIYDETYGSPALPCPL
jgi:hypothetical protein